MCTLFSESVLSGTFLQHDKHFGWMPFLTSLTIGTGHEFARKQLEMGKIPNFFIYVQFGFFGGDKGLVLFGY